jgi:Zn-dependent protease with chaperone function
VIAGRYLDGRSAAGIDATLEIGEDGFVRVHGALESVVTPVNEITISERLGNIPRRIGFPNGGSFETHDNDAVDALRDRLGIQPGAALVHWLESRWQAALGSLVAVVVISIVFFKWGIPALADVSAQNMPTRIDRSIGLGTLEILDRVGFEPTTLSSARQQELRDRFATMTKPLDDGHEYRLELRGGGEIGANAFALPSGIIVMTDELVALAEHDEELIAVLAHEIGHVRGRHALRHLLRAAGVTVLAFALLGDVSSISGILSAAPTLLHAKHSRDFEREADAFARKWLRDNGYRPSSFDAILCKLSGPDSKGSSGFDYFDSHPATAERARCPE